MPRLLSRTTILRSRLYFTPFFGFYHSPVSAASVSSTVEKNESGRPTRPHESCKRYWKGVNEYSRSRSANSTMGIPVTAPGRIVRDVCLRWRATNHNGLFGFTTVDSTSNFTHKHSTRMPHGRLCDKNLKVNLPSTVRECPCARVES